MSHAFTKPTCKELIAQFVEEKAGVLPETELSTVAGILSFLRMCLHTHAKLNDEELTYFQSLRLPGHPYHCTVAELFGPDKIEGVLYYLLRRFFKSNRVHCDEETIRRVPAVMIEFCDWLYGHGHVPAPIVEPFKKYERAMKHDASERRKGRVPFSDRPPKPLWPEEDYSVPCENARGSVDLLRLLEDAIELDTPANPWSDGPLH